MLAFDVWVGAVVITGCCLLLHGGKVLAPSWKDGTWRQTVNLLQLGEVSASLMDKVKKLVSDIVISYFCFGLIFNNNFAGNIQLYLHSKDGLSPRLNTR